MPALRAVVKFYVMIKLMAERTHHAASSDQTMMVPFVPMNFQEAKEKQITDSYLL
jgi:hypothetical protein